MKIYGNRIKQNTFVWVEQFNTIADVGHYEFVQEQVSYFNHISPDSLNFARIVRVTICMGHKFDQDQKPRTHDHFN